jgi:hypothetical protein
MDRLINSKLGWKGYSIVPLSAPRPSQPLQAYMNGAVAAIAALQAGGSSQADTRLLAAAAKGGAAAGNGKGGGGRKRKWAGAKAGASTAGKAPNAAAGHTPDAHATGPESKRKSARLGSPKTAHACRGRFIGAGGAGGPGSEGSEGAGVGSPQALPPPLPGTEPGSCVSERTPPDMRHGSAGESAVATASAPASYATGDVVEGNYRNGGEWFRGKISKVRPPPSKRRAQWSWDIEYDDGDAETRVFADRLRCPGPP